MTLRPSRLPERGQNTMSCLINTCQRPACRPGKADRGLLRCRVDSRMLLAFVRQGLRPDAITASPTRAARASETWSIERMQKIPACVGLAVIELQPRSRSRKPRTPTCTATAGRTKPAIARLGMKSAASAGSTPQDQHLMGVTRGELPPADPLWLRSRAQASGS